MKPSEVIITMKHAFEADCIPFIWGSPGIGKSMIAELASDHFFGPEDAEEKTKFMNKYEKAQYRKDYLLELRLGNKDLIDTTGSVKTTDDNWTIQCLPRFWEVTSKGKGMIMLDEANQTTKTMEKVLQQICDGRIGEWVKRHEWKIVCIGNNVSDKALARKLGTQFANRVFHIDYDVDNDEWIDWYFSMNLPFLVPAYITAKPDGRLLVHGMVLGDYWLQILLVICFLKWSKEWSVKPEQLNLLDLQKSTLNFLILKALLLRHMMWMFLLIQMSSIKSQKHWLKKRLQIISQTFWHMPKICRKNSLFSWSPEPRTKIPQFSKPKLLLTGVLRIKTSPFDACCFTSYIY